MTTEHNQAPDVLILHQDREKLQAIGAGILDDERVKYEAKTLRRLIRGLVKVQPADGIWEDSLADLKQIAREIKPGIRACTLLGLYQARSGIGHQLAIMAVYAIGPDDEGKNAFIEANCAAAELAFEEESFKEWCMGMAERVDQARQEMDDLDDNPPEIEPEGSVH